jgi:hypothetical protein
MIETENLPRRRQDSPEASAAPCDGDGGVSRIGRGTRTEALFETTRISANGTPNLSTSVVVPGGLPRAIPVSAMPKSIQKDKNSKVEYNIYFITLIRVHLFGTCRVQVHQD